MIKLTKSQKQLTVAGTAAVKPITKTAYFERILNSQMIGNNITNALNFVSQLIYYSQPNNRRMTPNNFYTNSHYVRSAATGYTSAINMG